MTRTSTKKGGWGDPGNPVLPSILFMKSNIRSLLIVCLVLEDDKEKSLLAFSVDNEHSEEGGILLSSNRL